jgi:hypothetical protein
VKTLDGVNVYFTAVPTEKLGLAFIVDFPYPRTMVPARAFRYQCDSRSPKETAAPVRKASQPGSQVWG